jgi:hypothetical protein
LAGITVAAWAHRRGRRLAGVTCCAITGLLISPFSWTHHWVWAVPLLAALAAIACRRRSAAFGLAAVAAAAVFSRRIPLFWPGHPPGLVRLLEGDLYVLCGLAVLAGTALALIWERVEAARQPVTPTRTLPVFHGAPRRLLHHRAQCISCRHRPLPGGWGRPGWKGGGGC